VGLLGWIIFGAIAGWIASLFAGTNDRQGCFLNIIVGVVGAFIGGLLMEFLTGSEFSFDFNLRSFAVAVVGAIILLAITGFARRRS
jgi:uncharacterized membrane protein YeaQ/YmgE (transglycosylase-associated protein family)